ncbi:hypothetical protein Thiowin_01895 [Thiorhodovibrio winogradskyi]|uniref:Uncharacterized protein n=1 Tax=Thiorhodovibrio winogradskyi TaxID=77007 RepID=A0ABZ0SBE5_9GAMM|nr:hypothetical protein [Thiorhodovibrio winogradskyi]
MTKQSPNKRQNQVLSTVIGKGPDSFFEYRINYEPTVDKNIPRQLRDQIEDIFPLIQSDPVQAIDRLTTLKKRYPKIPLISNHLIAAHGMLGNKAISRDLVIENYQENPDYIFAKINYAQMCLKANQPEKIPEIFEEKYDLKLLYPKRDEFHVTEFAGFTGVMCVYFSMIGEKDFAKRYYDALLQVAPDSDIATYTRHFIKPSLVEKLRLWLQARLRENEKKLKQAKKLGDKKPKKENDTHFSA